MRLKSPPCHGLAGALMPRQGLKIGGAKAASRSNLQQLTSARRMKIEYGNENRDV
ncbi:hypothetical protein REMIM1_PE00403 (plasmid) [Rhizobium etli bv. mimosae str. Mim1]|nr:hypothetical protein REMIM1_PE00403 [Rhizobium etli bv. mimosae str. Mim1]